MNSYSPESIALNYAIAHTRRNLVAAWVGHALSTYGRARFGTEPRIHVDCNLVIIRSGANRYRLAVWANNQATAEFTPAMLERFPEPEFAKRLTVKVLPTISGNHEMRLSIGGKQYVARLAANEGDFHTATTDFDPATLTRYPTESEVEVAVSNNNDYLRSCTQKDVKGLLIHAMLQEGVADFEVRTEANYAAICSDLSLVIRTGGEEFRISLGRNR